MVLHNLSENSEVDFFQDECIPEDHDVEEYIVEMNSMTLCLPVSAGHFL